MAVVRWGLLWCSQNELDGYREHILFEKRMPMLFLTRAEAREWATARYGYIRTRPDLRAEPHGWRMPKPVRIALTVQP